MGSADAVDAEYSDAPGSIHARPDANVHPVLKTDRFHANFALNLEHCIRSRLIQYYLNHVLQKAALRLWPVYALVEKAHAESGHVPAETLSDLAPVRRDNHLADKTQDSCYC